jgi:uncharacterized repeat protein (TIGR01451 family)
MGRERVWDKAVLKRTVAGVLSVLLLILGACAPEVPPTPKPSPPLLPDEGQLSITLAAPPGVEPGTQFDYELEVTNKAGISAQDVLITFNVPLDLTIAAVSDDGMIDGNQVRWVLAEMAGETTVSRRVTVGAPSTHAILVAQDYSVQAGDWLLSAVGTPVYTRIEGGIASIGVVRSLVGERVTVEGITTMVSHGYRSGGTGPWFYIQDETGGIRVQLSDQAGVLPALALGERVRATGEVSNYLGSLRVVVGGRGAVEVLDRGESPVPDKVTIAEVADGAQWAGRLIATTGQAIQVEEFADGYEIELAGDQGDVLLAYGDKLAGFDLEVERIEVGRQYTVAGIGEMYGKRFYLKPRTDTDVVEVPLPALAVEGHAPANVLPGETLEYTFTVANRTAAPLVNVVVTSTLPAGDAILAAVEDGGELITDTLRWAIPSLLPHEDHSVRFSVVVAAGYITGEVGSVALDRYAAWADGWPFREVGLPLRTFISDSVPIYAIQGSGFVSPYALDVVDTEGVVTGVFPGLGGFWIQGLMPDGDPLTSEGLFVYAGGVDLERVLHLEPGDRVKIRGRVRERWGQTEIHVAARQDVVVADGDLPLPDPVELAPPVGIEAAVAYYEPLEGMLVSVTDAAIAVSPTSCEGEYALVRSEQGVDRVLEGQETGLLITVDDGSLSWHADGTTISPTVRTGDWVGNSVGPLAFVSGGHKIEPMGPPAVSPAPAEPVEPLPQPGPGEFSIATFNAGGSCESRAHYDPDVLPGSSSVESERKRDGIVETIVALGAPTIVGLQALENEGALEDAANQPVLAAYGYQPALIEATDDRGAGVGFLVRGDRGTLKGVGRFQAPVGLFVQPPLMITTTVSLAGADGATGDATVYAIVSDFIGTVGSGALSGPHRVMQAAWIASLVDEILVYDPTAYVVVLGDLNDGQNSAPLQALTKGPVPGGRLVNVTEVLPAADRYSTISHGVSRLLDYILVTPALAARQVRANVLHVNADYPPSNPADQGPYRSSGHDPVVVVFRVGE